VKFIRSFFWGWVILFSFSHFLEGRLVRPRHALKIQTIEKTENTKEVCSFLKSFQNQRRYAKTLRGEKRFQKSANYFRREFNMRTLNRPLMRRGRSKVVGVASLHRLKDNKNR
jgi:hypothetical protein